MPGATKRFLDEMKKSHTVLSYVDVTSPANETRRLVCTGGEVNVDRTAQIRRGAHFDCIDPDGTWVPKDTTGILTPFGSELRPYRGVVYGNGDIEVYPLGVFRLSRSHFHASAAVSNAGIRIQLEAFDRSRVVSRDKFTSVYTVPQGTNIVAAIKLIIARTFPDAQYDAVSTAMTTTAPKVFAANNDPWFACMELAKSMGCEIFFDVYGKVVIAPPTDIDALPAPHFSYIDGYGSTMIDMGTEYTDEPGFNGVIVEGASPGDDKPPVRAEAWDMQPKSPTYRYGPYGEVPKYVTDTNVKTTAECQAMATSLLKGEIGFAAQLTVSSWTNPALEAGDVIEVKRPAMNVNSMYTIDAFNVPLSKDGIQNIRLRTRRLAQ